MSKLLTTLEIDVISDSEEILSQAFSDFSRAGFTISVNYSAVVDIVKTENRHGIFVIISESLESIEKSLETLLDLGIDTNQIIVGTIANSFSHKLLSKALNLKNFSFGFEKTPVGPVITLTGMIETVSSFGVEQLQLTLDRELRFARESGVMNILVSSVQDASIEKITNRAIVSNTLLNSVSAKVTFRSNAIRLAIFLDILKLPNPNLIVANSRHLWPVRNEIKFALEVGAYLTKSDPIPSNAPLGLLICWASEFLLNPSVSAGRPTDHFFEKIRLQSFPTRTLLKAAINSFGNSRGSKVDVSA